MGELKDFLKDYISKGGKMPPIEGIRVHYKEALRHIDCSFLKSIHEKQCKSHLEHVLVIKIQHTREG